MKEMSGGEFKVTSGNFFKLHRGLKIVDICSTRHDERNQQLSAFKNGKQDSNGVVMIEMKERLKVKSQYSFCLTINVQKITVNFFLISLN